MSSFRNALLAIILLQFIPCTEAAESSVDFGSFALTLPDGYSDKPGRGIDSRVGEITIAGKSFKIHYDDYSWGTRSETKSPTKLSEFPKEMLDSLIYYERLQNEPLETFVTAWYHPNDPSRRYPIVSLDVLGIGASFSIQLDSRAAVKDAIETIRAIRVSKPKPKAL